MPVKVESSPILPGLSPVCGRSIVARFDGGTMSSDGGLLALREIEQRLAIAQRLAACIPDPRSPDDTFDAVHGGQQLRLFNAHHDEYGFQPIVVFDGDGRMIAAVLRPASRPKGRQIVRWLHRLITAIRANWPRVAIMLRAESHYCTPEVLRFCRARRLDYTLGVAPTSTLRKHITDLEQSTAAGAAATADGQKLRRFKVFHDGSASWDRVERIVARVEAGP
jgi:hypothetical protein